MDRNYKIHIITQVTQLSLSARRAWIEIFIRREISLMRPVALRKESVDRNINAHIVRMPFGVALRKESVDRNPIAAFLLMWWQVALRKESVDRNPRRQQALNAVNASLSARRAWIEIRALSCRSSAQRWSLSARRAWIEII